MWLVKQIVGFEFVLQQTPLEVIVAPPSEVMFPPLITEFMVIELQAVVVIVGNVATGSIISSLSFVQEKLTRRIKNRGNIFFIVDWVFYFDF